MLSTNEKKYIKYNVFNINNFIIKNNESNVFIEFISNFELNNELNKISEFLTLNNKIGIKINNKNQLNFILNNSALNNINNFLIEENLVDEKDIHFLYLINKNINVNILNKKNIEKILLNPIISNLGSLENEFIFNKKLENKDIINETFYFDVKRYCNFMKNYNYKEIIYKNIIKVWGFFKSYYIFNLNCNKLKNDDIKEIYNYLSSNIGRIVQCRPVNSNKIERSYTRDVKFIPDSKHFYSSNIMQPLHTDFAYFTYKKAPDYLTLFCLQKSEYGGITSLISTKKIMDIMKKYNNNLYNKVKNINFTYKSQEDKDGNFEIHNKIFYDEKTNYLNWNYFQIKEENNSKKKMELKEEIFKFFNEIISKGYMYDLNISWERGDCILFNDHLNLHTRTSFLGERWLSGNAFFIK